MRGINYLKVTMSLVFERKDLGAPKKILGIRISQDRFVVTSNMS